ncbi:response regulator transcription factor [Halobacillus shinanisalinarum]|uniref:Response regulator transcription factor n=1 Tax=Halobacillus shinanisalinarum TaxID=2932258 RepID=A0ABY4GX34_9BACI|nr:response regulator transcription factor [Halobacillus shinanisalinarum]UOQ92629.1 response regulator transcription factor [Halobacillus shinanisalinarum]
MKIFIIEDDQKIAMLLAQFLEKYGYQPHVATQFDQIKQEFIQVDPQLVLLDINLPRFDGFYWCRQIRTQSNCPILFISARDSGMDQVMAIENGGDDYITKPFDNDVVLAKIKGLIRRVYGEYAEAKQTSVIELNGLTLDFSSMEAVHQFKKVMLTKKEFVLLKEFMDKPSQVLSRDHLLGLLWDDLNFVDDNTLTVNITRVRKKLSDIGVDQAIVTVRGTGYKLAHQWKSES